MALSPYTPTTRRPKNAVVLRNQQFARWLSRRTGVSYKALVNALTLLSQGIIDCLAAGYQFQWIGLGRFEVREMPSRKRYHRQLQKMYMAPPHTIVKFTKVEGLNQKVRDLSKALLEVALENPTVPPVKR